MQFQSFFFLTLMLVWTSCRAEIIGDDYDEDYDEDYIDVSSFGRHLTSKYGSANKHASKYDSADKHACESEAFQVTRVNISSPLVQTLAPKLYIFNDSNHNLNWSLTLTPLTRRIDNNSSVEIMTFALNASCTTSFPSIFVCSLQKAKLVKTSARPRQLRQLGQLRREPIHLKQKLPLTVYQPSSGPYAPLNEFEVYSCPNECSFVVELSSQLKSHVSLDKPKNAVIHL